MGSMKKAWWETVFSGLVIKLLVNHFLVAVHFKMVLLTPDFVIGLSQKRLLTLEVINRLTQLEPFRIVDTQAVA